MSLDIPSIRTVCIRPMLPQGERTLTEYQASIVAKFGKLPSWGDLAKRENAQMRRLRDGCAPQELTEKARARILEKRKAEGDAVGDIVLSTLSRPMTLIDVGNATGLPHSSADWHLRRLLAQGKVKREKVKRLYIWERADAPDYKPPQRQPVEGNPVTVRGEAFPSMRACAKALGVTVQAVADAVKRGKEDMIGSRKRKAAQQGKVAS